jgi:Zn-dependent protease with chaperone function
MFSLLVFLVGTAAVLALLNALSLRPWRRAASAHWTERARLLYPIRRSHAGMFLVFPGTAALLAYWLPFEFSPVGAAVGAFLGVVLAGHVIDRAVFPSWSFRSWLAYASSVLLQSVFGWAVLIAGILLMPRPLDACAGWIVAAYLALNLALAAGALNLLWRRLHYVRPASPRLAAIVAEASATTGVPVRATWELDIPVQYAAALVVTRELAFSKSLVDHADDAALRSICLHELGHLAESRWIAFLRSAAAPLSNVPYLFVLPVFDSRFPSAVFLLWLVSVLLRRGYALLSVRWEKSADRYALQHTPEPGIYARALERLHEWNLIPMVLSKRSAQTHPDTYDRMVAAGVTPSYERPAPPESHTAIGLVLQIGFGLALGIFLAIQARG